MDIPKVQSLVPRGTMVTYVTWDVLGGHPFALVGQAKDFFALGKKISLNAAPILCNDQL